MMSADVHDPERFKDSKAMFHRVGTGPETDHEVFSRATFPELGIRPEQIPVVQYEKRSGRLYGMLFTVDRRFIVYDAPMTRDPFSGATISWRFRLKAEDNVVDMGGFKETKPNTWKDMIACADYLVRENYTSRSELVIFGGSAGGITVGRAVIERPDLFAAVIPAVTE